MNVRAIALALPLVMGIAACKTSSTQSSGGQTASTEQPRSGQGEATASSGTTAGAEGTASAGTTTGEPTASGTMGGDTSASGSMSGTPGSMSGSASADTSDDLKAHSSDELLSGKVTKVSAREVSIESERGEEKTLELAPETVVTIDGRDARPAELKEGQEVRASFNTVEGKDIAVEIRAGEGSTGTGSDMGTGSGSTGATDPMGGPTGSGSTGMGSDTGSSGSTGSDPGSTGGASDTGSTGSTGTGTTGDSGSTSTGSTTDPAVK